MNPLGEHLWIAVMAGLCLFAGCSKSPGKPVSKSHPEAGKMVPSSQADASVQLTAHLIESIDHDSHFLFLVREDVKRIESEEDTREIAPGNGAKIAGIFPQDQTKIILDGIRSSDRHQIAATSQETVATGESVDFLLGAWRIKVEPRPDPAAGTIALDYMIKHQGKGDGHTESVTIWSGHTVVIQITEEGAPPSLIFVTAK